MFVKTKHNQRYHSPECCKKATNEKIMKKYYEKKRRLNGAERMCIECLGPLSRYNDTNVCSGCQKLRDSKRVQELLEDFG